MNILSFTATTPPATPPRSRQASSSYSYTASQKEQRAGSREAGGYGLDVNTLDEKLGASQPGRSQADAPEEQLSEKTPLLEGSEAAQGEIPEKSKLWQIPKRISHALLYCGAVLISPITIPGRYVIACFYDEDGHFSAILPLRNLRSLLYRRRRKSAAQAGGLDSVSEMSEKEEKPQRRTSSRRSPSVDSVASNTSAGTSDGEAENEGGEDSPARHTRSKTLAATASQHGEDMSTHKKSRSVRLLPNEEALRKRKVARAQQKKRDADSDDVAAVASALKSPSSPANNSKLTRYPRAPAPPRPLVPRRQPSYILSYSPDTPKKTLIIDLDETLIHSMAKGGRMSTGHMVEVRLSGHMPNPGYPFGNDVPILYYVHERPNCHEFLRKVAKWYNLIVFTASVQEYADPVIDWVERERKYFSGRYYRQHCTLRNGAYIKDLAQVEPDLSRVMILDNSPMSYIFHEDNAIPIEGWISDPTDNDLLHLIPFLEGLQYVTDVRALLALRQGQAQQA